MMRFSLQPEPPHFAERVARPGDSWLARNAAGRPPSYWNKIEPELAAAFGSLCAYSAIYLPNGTVDHFVSAKENRDSLYEWNNYRYAAAWLNSSKSNLDSRAMIDPFEVQDNWFEIILPSLQLVLTRHVPAHMRSRAQTMLDRLHLGHDERVVRVRREWYRMYQEGQLTLEGLRAKAPLIAAAVEREA